MVSLFCGSYSTFCTRSLRIMEVTSSWLETSVSLSRRSKRLMQLLLLFLMLLLKSAVLVMKPSADNRWCLPVESWSMIRSHPLFCRESTTRSGSYKCTVLGDDHLSRSWGVFLCRCQLRPSLRYLLELRPVAKVLSYMQCVMPFAELISWFIIL